MSYDQLSFRSEMQITIEYSLLSIFNITCLFVSVELLYGRMSTQYM